MLLSLSVPYWIDGYPLPETLKTTTSVCRVIDGAGDADALGDPLPDALGDPLSGTLGDPIAAADWDVAGLLVLLEETHPTMAMIITRVSGGAAIKKGVRRQKGFGP